MTTKMYTGESRMIEFTISDTKGEDFTIGEAYYVVTQGSEVTDSGLMEIDGHTLSLRMAPTKVGVHVISLKYVIGSDVMKDKYLIEVVEG